MARKHEVLALHAKGMSSPEIAGHLGCMDEYVRATLQRAGLRSHSKRGRVLPRCQTKGLVVEIPRHTPLAEDVMAEIGERASVALCAKLGVAPSADWHVLQAVMVGRVIRVTMSGRRLAMAKRIPCQVPFCKRTAPNRGQDEVICGKHWRLADRSLTRRYKALAKWINRHKDDPAVERRTLARRWHTAARAWRRIKTQAIERAMGI